MDSVYWKALSSSSSRATAATAVAASLVGSTVTALMVVAAAVVFAKRWFRRFSWSSSSSSTALAHNNKRNKQERSQRKKIFLTRAGESYGYRCSQKGAIDQWRSAEYPKLISPNYDKVNDTSLGRMVYLDYAGAALPAKTQLEAVLSSSSSSILANPHSTGPAASQALSQMERARQRVAEHFNCEPGRLAGLDSVPGRRDPADLHPGYEVVFTSGATESLRLVAERFPWSPACSCGGTSLLVYAHNSHTSVVGMRGPALRRGATFQCRHLDEIEETEDYSVWLNAENDCENHAPTSPCCCQQQRHHLLVVSAECNFGGTRPKSVKSIVERAKQGDGGWLTMIDYAKAASTGVVNLKDDDPDFACVSFYKMFGEPTGLGALFVRRQHSASSILVGKASPEPQKQQQQQQQEKKEYYYFGGGAVDVVLASKDFSVPREQPSLLASLTSGTVHFRGIASLLHGFDELQSLGGMPAIHAHAACLAEEFVRRLRQLKHGNGKPAVVIYGAWGKEIADRARAPTIVSFNCLRSDGSFVGYNEVAKLAELHNPPMQLRTGCFCNPGACQEALGLSDDDIQQNYFANGHVCGDHIDIVDERPTGAIRASFGKDSIWEDMDCLATFLEETFVNTSSDSTLSLEKTGGRGSVQAQVTELYIFPIKSCAAQRVKSWSLDSGSGRLELDREFALVDSSGTAMRLQKYPKMSQIRPVVDCTSMTMTVSAPGCQDLILSIRDDDDDDDDCCPKRPNGIIQVCGNKCGGQLWGSYDSSKWFSTFLGVQCWLARHTPHLAPQPKNAADAAALYSSFANEEPILLISQNAVNRLNLVLKSQGQSYVQTKHFRPNIVVSLNSDSSYNDSLNTSHNTVTTSPPLFEASWTRIQHMAENDQISFVTMGECARCSMVDIDPTTGRKGGRTLQALAKHNRSSGRITFGIFLRRAKAIGSNLQEREGGAAAVIGEGDFLACE